eukprot:PhF_6_TR31358/c0_g1_i3/m.45890/K21249/UVRAG; UV radiation resistance-associated gene protein
MSSVRVPLRIRKLRHVIGFFYRQIEPQNSSSFDSTTSANLLMQHQQSPNTGEDYSFELIAVDPTQNTETVLYKSETCSGTSSPTWVNLPHSTNDLLIQHTLTTCFTVRLLRDGCTVSSDRVLLADMIFVAPNVTALAMMRGTLEKGLYIECIDGVFIPGHARSNSVESLGALTTNTSNASFSTPLTELTTRTSRATKSGSSALRINDMRCHAVRVEQYHYAIAGATSEVSTAKEYIQQYLIKKQAQQERLEAIENLRHRHNQLQKWIAEKSDVLSKKKKEIETKENDLQQRKEHRAVMQEELRQRQDSIVQTDTHIHQRMAISAAFTTAIDKRRRVLLEGIEKIFKLDMSPSDATRPIKLCGMRQPSPTDTIDEDAAVFYGHLAHAVLMIANALGIHLRHNVVCLSSRSFFVEGEHGDVRYPLYVSKSADRVKFKSAVGFMRENLHHIALQLNKSPSASDPLLTILQTIFTTGLK